MIRCRDIWGNYRLVTDDEAERLVESKKREREKDKQEYFNLKRELERIEHELKVLSDQQEQTWNGTQNCSIAVRQAVVDIGRYDTIRIIEKINSINSKRRFIEKRWGYYLFTDPGPDGWHLLPCYP